MLFIKSVYTDSRSKLKNLLTTGKFGKEKTKERQRVNTWMICLHSIVEIGAHIWSLTLLFVLDGEPYCLRLSTHDDDHEHNLGNNDFSFYKFNYIFFFKCYINKQLSIRINGELYTWAQLNNHFSWLPEIDDKVNSTKQPWECGRQGEPNIFPGICFRACHKSENK